MRKPKERWMKHLNKGLIENVLKLDNPLVDFYIKEPEYILCYILTSNNNKIVHKVSGLSICSVVDKHKFNYRTGKSKAIVRALKALKNKNSSGLIRKEEFPRSWSTSQVKRIKDMSLKQQYKSVYYF